MRNGEPIHVCSGRWMHRDDDCHCPCYFCRLYSDDNPRHLVEAEQFDGSESLNPAKDQDAGESH